MRQGRRETHPSTGRTRRPVPATSLPRAQRARSRSPTLTLRPSGSLPTQTAGCRATRERKPLRRSRSGVSAWRLVVSPRTDTPERHRRPFLFDCHARPPPTRPRGTPSVASSQAQKPRSECRPQRGGRKPPSSAMPTGSRPPFPSASRASCLPLSESRRLQDQAHRRPQPVAFGAVRAATVVAAIVTESSDPAQMPKRVISGQSTRKRLARIAHKGLEGSVDVTAPAENRPASVIAVNGLGGGLPRFSRPSVS